MLYLVRHKETGEEKVLQESQVNDMVTNDRNEVIVFDTEMEPYFLLDERGEVVQHTSEAAN
jgi:hypothetical protein